MNFERYKYHIRGGGVKREQALSEVIGFLMIVALLTILFSMYLLYVVPIQGRDAEISHMKYITQEFIGLKADIDGLIINNKINLPIARSFELGTLSSVGSGALSIMPLSSFIEATGTLMVNEQNDFLMVSVNGSMMDISDIEYSTPPISNPILEINCISKTECLPSNIENPKCISDRCYNFTIKERYSMNNTPGTITVTNPIYIIPTPTALPTWSVDQIINMSNFTANISFNMVPQYDLVLETLDNSTSRNYIAEKTIIENLTFGKNYTYNILKDNDIIPNNSTEYSFIHRDEEMIYSPHTIMSKVGKFPPRIGSFQYNSKNRYWVNQNLFYEMGGLFLIQPTGGSSVMLIPSIALTPFKNITSETTDYNLKVSVNNIRITDTEDISGSVSAQIFSKVDQINQNFFNGSTNISSITSNYGTEQTNVTLWKMQDNEEPNAKVIWIQFLPDDPRIINASSRESRKLTEDEIKRMRETTILWKRGFDQIKTITNKTLSDNSELSPIIGTYSTWIYNFRTDYINDDSVPLTPPFSANLVIGQNVDSLKLACPPNTTSTEYGGCMGKVQDYLENPCSEPSKCEDFILDYSESELSLVMQSGAL
ncbi:hypothetical protein DLD82_05025 [Methanospirillum stamsii]|uniref:Uncharacterized protein n=3 Tax=Methanospirillum stamsii TaxID=1277351 RepID=A0A2V2N5Z0_9EURY|nr:hypothetical protein DLD82_05025 [Methanospirillum stamsii]